MNIVNQQDLTALFLRTGVQSGFYCTDDGGRAFGNGGVILAIFLISSLFLNACANAVAPSGGKPDKTPPAIIATEPLQRALNAHPQYIALEFNKFIQQRNQVHQSLFLTPPIKTEYFWSGKTIYVNFKEPLDSNTTVALTLGTQYSDWDGNKPESAYTLIFSTGSKLDSGTIRARVDTDKPDGLTAFLYPLTTRPDTLNPGTTKPKYKTQIGSNKTLEFPALAAGAYRLFVLRDEYRNDLLDKGVDAFSTAVSDIWLPEGGTAEMLIKMAPVEDVAPPRIYEVRQISAQRLSVRFSEKIHPASLRADNFTLRDSLETLAGSELPRIIALHPDGNNPAVIRCYTDKPLPSSAQQQSSTWRFKAIAVRDSAGNTIADSTNTAFWKISNEATIADSTLPMLLRTQILTAGALSPFMAPVLADSVRNVPQKPRIAFTFSEALALSVTTASASGIVWESASGKAVDFAVSLAPHNRLMLEPRTALAPNAWYTLGFRTQSLQAWDGRSLRDSVVLLRFQTEDARDYGGISGTIADSVVIPSTIASVGIIKKNTATQATISTTSATMPSAINLTRSTLVRSTMATRSTGGQFVIVLETAPLLTQSASANSTPSPQSATSMPPSQSPASTPTQAPSPFAQQRFELRLAKPGAWELSTVPPGSYRLTAFVDANGNGRYDYGSVFPYSPAERFIVFPTDLQVRPRWTIDNVRIIVP